MEAVMSQTGFVRNTLGAIAVAAMSVAFLFERFGKSLRGLPNLGIEELPDLVADDGNFTIDRLDRRKCGDDRHVRFFGPKGEVTYTARWVNGQGLVENINVTCPDRRGMHLVFIGK